MCLLASTVFIYPIIKNLYITYMLLIIHKSLDKSGFSSTIRSNQSKQFPFFYIKIYTINS